MMTSVHPIAEFRDADQYWQSVAGDGHEIIRPKPRRPSECRHSSEAVIVTCNSERKVVQMGTGSSILKQSPNQDNDEPELKTTVPLSIISKNTREIKSPMLESVPTTTGMNIIVKAPNREKLNQSENLSREKEKPPIPLKPLHDCFHSFKLSNHDTSCQSSYTPVMNDVNNSVTIRVEPYTGNISSNKDDTRWKDQDVDNNSRTIVLNTTSPVSTDCGSLSKSSSDGDAVILRKRPPTKLKSRRRNILNFPHHLSVDEFQFMARRQDSYSGGCGGSSSDENRSSGHASMSDSRASSSPAAEPLTILHFVPDRNDHDHSKKLHNDDYQKYHLNHEPVTVVGISHRSQLKCVPEDDKVVSTQPCKPIMNKKIQFGRNRYQKDDMRIPIEGNSGLEDIRQAIETLTIRSQGSRTSYSTSTYSSMSGSESEQMVRRLIRHSSLETINTNVTNADEFVWIDSHSRLVELQHLPWTNKEILQVLQNGRLKDSIDQISVETIPRLSHLLQRALVRISREIQRFAKPLGICSKKEVNSALKVILAPALADSCVKASMRAAAMYTVSGDQQFRQSKSARAGLQLSIGHVHRWMCDVRLGKFIHEYSAVSLTAAMENLLEEIVLICMMQDSETTSLTPSSLDYAIANSGDLWGLLQAYSHLNAGRIASGTLALPRWPSQLSDISSRSGSSVQLNEEKSRIVERSMEQSLLTTCVGSVGELGELLSRVVQHHNSQHAATSSNGRQAITWGPPAVHTLFYFMRCSQLEHADHRNEAPIQELNYERPYIVLPPLVEWARIALAHTEHRFSSVVDKDDVMQAARLLLPGIDCPIRQSSYDELTCAKRMMDDNECARRFKIAVAFRMLTCGRTDLLPHALQLLPLTRINTLNDQGLTLLMLACMRGDETTVQILLNNGANVDIEVPSKSSVNPCVSSESQHWTALTYAAVHGHVLISKMLLDKGANVEGGAQVLEDKQTVTPLQLAAASGNVEMVSLLLSHGAHPFLSTMTKDSLCYGSAAQRGCYSALSVAAAHGQRTVLHKLLSHPFNNGNKDVLSLEEMLAEGTTQLTNERKQNRIQISPVSLDDSKIHMLADVSEYMQILKLSKQQVKALQEAMYHSAENGHIEITLDLRNIGIPWTLHCWMDTLATAHELHLESIIDQLLQDFQAAWPEDCSAQFIAECLPLLFSIFQHSKNEGTSLLLADIFSNCYGKELIESIEENYNAGGARIDPKYVNNPELSDIQFRVENRIFYAHKIILVNASPRFKSLLSNKHGETSPPAIQINDIRYEIFQLVMQYLYKGGCDDLDVEQNDILELMAAANYFLLSGLLRYCEVCCTHFISQDNIVTMYLHAKIYNAERLLSYCQGYLIQNMVALLTYDDSVRRLIFGKKLHNHDVLGGLLNALQVRIKIMHKKQLTHA